MEFTIKSKKFEKEITFSVPGKTYVYADINGQPGTLGNQICAGGSLMGETISFYGNDKKNFEQVCRNWWAAYLKKNRY